LTEVIDRIDLLLGFCTIAIVANSIEVYHTFATIKAATVTISNEPSTHALLTSPE